MAAMDKLYKAFEALKIGQPHDQTDDAAQKKREALTPKEKMFHCSTIADAITMPQMRTVGDFPKFLGVAMETFLMCCDDDDSDVRMIADECLNRTIKTLIETNLGRIQVELYKEIKKNGSPRTLRAALWRFADLCHLIRPQKCRPYVANMLPNIYQIIHRSEESVQETLASAMLKIAPVFGKFTNDGETRNLLKQFLPNLKSLSAVFRRTAATCLTAVCQFSRKPTLFFAWLLNALIEMLIPVSADQNVPSLLGAMVCLRHIIPHLNFSKPTSFTVKGSFGLQHKEPENYIGLDQLIQVYEVLIHYTQHPDHNVVTTSLETLLQLIQTPPPLLLKTLLSTKGINRTRIFLSDVQELGLCHVSGSEIGSMQSLTTDEMGIEDDLQTSEASALLGANSLSDLVTNDSELSTSLSTTASHFPDDELADQMSYASVDDEDKSEYSNIKISRIKDTMLTHAGSVGTLSRPSPKRRKSLKKGVSDDRIGDHSDDEGAWESGTPTLSPGIDIPFQVGNIGLVTDPSCPLVYCTRLLSSSFLLTGCKGRLMPDKNVRVSVKALACSCISAIVQLQPNIFFLPLFKPDDEDSSSDIPAQSIRDILLFSLHSDPQLRGSSSQLIGSLIKAGLRESSGKFDNWAQSHGPSPESTVTLQHLADILLKLLQDESSITCRMTVNAIHHCLVGVLHSDHSQQGIRLLNALIPLSHHPYWLVKVVVLELLSDIPFKVTYYLESSSLEMETGLSCAPVTHFQDHVFSKALIPLLGDDDSRVRQAAANAVCRIIPKLFHCADHPHQDPVTALAKEKTDAYLDPIMRERCFPCHPIVHGLVKPYDVTKVQAPSPTVELALSRVVELIVRNLVASTSKFLTIGCCQALCLLSEEYMVTVYPYAWTSGLLGTNALTSNYSSVVKNQASPGSSKEEMLASESQNNVGLGHLTLSLITSTTLAMDLMVHQHVLQLVGNLFAGMAFKVLQPKSENVQAEGGQEEDVKWGMLSDKQVSLLADRLLVHLCRLLNVFAHVIEAQIPVSPPTKTALPSLPSAPSLSPIKRKNKAKDGEISQGAIAGISGKHSIGKSHASSEKEEKNEKEKLPLKITVSSTALGSFIGVPHYLRFCDVLRSAFSNYKLSLDIQSSERFSSLLNACLTALSKVLEIATVVEIGEYAEEILCYLKITVSMEPTSTILCVQQLLKALFATNLSSLWEGPQQAIASRKPGRATRLMVPVNPGLYHSCFTAPYTQLMQSLSDSVAKSATSTEPEETNSTSWLGWVRKRSEKKFSTLLKNVGRSGEKSSLASYIRLFEPLVIKALKQYTVTSSVPLHCQVLQLLSQLVQLRVNYCLLDSEQIFIGFIIKQFEYIEEGQIQCTEQLLPSIFHFLVLLSYERYHSKMIIGVPKIIQLCDGIMASGQPPLTHAIPALRPIVEDLFLVRGIMNKADAGKELDTQREVLISMLLRLVQYHQVLEMFILILQQNRKEGEDKWKKLSRQVIDIILPLLAKQQIILEDQIALDVLHHLLETLAQSVFRPVDMLLKIMFSPPYNLSTLPYLQRWVCMVLALLRVLIAQSKEEVVLGRLSEMNLHVTLFTDTVHAHQTQESSPDTIPPHPGFLTHSPEETIARFLLQVVGVIASEIRRQSYTPSIPIEGAQFLCQQLAHFLLYIMHMFQSGIYRRVANICMTLIKNEAPPGFFTVHEINRAFLQLAPYYPTLTLQWCNVLILLNFDDQDFWSEVMRTPIKRNLPIARLNSDMGKSIVASIHFEMLRTGGLILFCDYVCENLTDAEHMTWLIVNHVNELVCLSSEPPVQDLIGAIHRNSAASGLFIQAIQARCDNLAKPAFAKKILSCLEAIHSSQSGMLVMLIINKLLTTHHLAVARACEALACHRIEALLVEIPEEGANQFPLEDLNRQMEVLQQSGNMKRHTQLTMLLRKLRTHCFADILDTGSTPPLTHFSTSLSIQRIKDTTMNKEWYISIVKRKCFSTTAVGRECAQLLLKLDYDDIIAVFSAKEFNLGFLEDCLLLGIESSVRTYTKEKNAPSETPRPLSSPTSNPENSLHHASMTLLLQHVTSIMEHVPRPHQTFIASENAMLSPKEVKYHRRLTDLLSDPVFGETLFQIVPVVTLYLKTLPILPWQTEVPAESLGDLGRFCVLCFEALHWLIEKEIHPCPQQMQACLNLVQAMMQNENIAAVFGLRDHVTWVCSGIYSIHRVMSYVLKGESLPSLPVSGMKKGFVDSDIQRASQCCDLAASLLLWLEQQVKKPKIIPAFYKPLKSIIIGLARLSPVNSYCRTPPIVWQMGWCSEFTGNPRLTIPPLPINFLQEQEVLKQFIFRVNTLGWTSRQQFEETWMALLGVLSATPINCGSNPEEEAERVQTSCLAVKCITVLLLQTMMLPQPGNPQNSTYLHQKRDKPLAFLHTRCGKKLSVVRNIVQQKLREMIRNSSSIELLDAGKDFSDTNLERSLCPNKYSFGQVSLDYLWTATGIMDEPDSDDEVPPLSFGSGEYQEREQCLAASGLDIHSCLHFLLDLYSQWMNTNVNTKTPLSLLTEAIRSVIQLSDIFTERSQFEWMLEVLSDLHRNHPQEDDIMYSYLTIGIFKSAAVTGIDMEMADRLKRLAESGLKSAHLPTRISALYGLLYLLEQESSEEILVLLTTAMDYLQKHLDTNYNPSSCSEEYLLLMWTLAFYIVENFHKDIQELDFSSTIVQLSIQVASTCDETYPISIYLLIIHGLERLLLAEVITGKYAEMLVKFSVDKFCQSNPVRAFASLSLMLSCMYAGKEKDKWSPTEPTAEIINNKSDPYNIHSTDAESLIVAMERVTVLFDRIKKGYPYEAEVIAEILPIFLMDFFPMSDIMNKVIGEFISNQQPHPHLLAHVVFQVFERVYLQSQQPLIQEWVMLSLSNFTQRTPVSMAIWSLTSFFISASTNCWIRALFPHAQQRMGKLEPFDKELFCLTAIDFCKQLMEKTQQKIFRQTIASVAQPDDPYTDLLNCL